MAKTLYFMVKVRKYVADRWNWWTWNAGTPTHNGHFSSADEAKQCFQDVFSEGWEHQVYEIKAHRLASKGEKDEA